MSTTISLTDRTVGELAVEMPDSIRVFEEWKIDYCCGGRMPLADACAAAGKTVAAFMAALDGVATVDSTRDWKRESLAAIAEGIVGMYHDYTREELKTLTPLAAKVLGVHGSRHSELEHVVDLIDGLASDMLPHMLKEEQVLFPYVVEMESSAREKRPAPTPFFGTVKNPVRMMMLEHDAVGELLVQLRRVTNEYVPPQDACFSYRELYRRLSVFESRTHEHIHIENNLFFPRAVDLEERAGEPAEFAHGCGGASCGH